jgi:hypothetical protein
MRRLGNSYRKLTKFVRPSCLKERTDWQATSTLTQTCRFGLGISTICRNWLKKVGGAQPIGAIAAALILDGDTEIGASVDVVANGSHIDLQAAGELGATQAVVRSQEF